MKVYVLDKDVRPNEKLLQEVAKKYLRDKPITGQYGFLLQVPNLEGYYDFVMEMGDYRSDDMTPKGMFFSLKYFGLNIHVFTAPTMDVEKFVVDGQLQKEVSS